MYSKCLTLNLAGIFGITWQLFSDIDDGVTEVMKMIVIEIERSMLAILTEKNNLPLRMKLIFSSH